MFWDVGFGKLGPPSIIHSYVKFESGLLTLKNICVMSHA